MNTHTQPPIFASRLFKLALACAVVALVALTPSFSGAAPAFKVLIFKNTPALERFHAEAVAAGITAITELGQANSFAVDVSENPADFNAAKLAQYKAVIFLSPEGQRLDTTQRQAFQSYIQNGGGYVGIHGAMYMERATQTYAGWPWYRDLVGANPKGGGPPIAQAVVRVVNKNHPSTAHLGDAWTRTDEWYGFQSVSPNVTVLANVDENTYDPGIHAMGNPHPIAWYQTLGSGRSWYTGGGHFAASFNESDFRKHILGGILWAANAVPTTTPTPTTTVQPATPTPTRTAQPTTTAQPTPTTIVVIDPPRPWRGFIPLAAK